MNFKICIQYLSIISILFIAAGCHQRERLVSIDIIKNTHFSWEGKQPCTIVYSDENGTVEMPAEIKYRGGHSSRYEKHSYSLELIKKYKLASLPKDDDWILNASYIDKTFMRHKISYDLYREMRPENVSAQSTYANVSVNNQPQGLYLLTEEVNGGQVKLNKKDTLAMIFKDPPFLFEKKIPNPQDTNNYYQQKFPKLGTRDQTPYIESFKSFLFRSSEKEFAHNIANWIDIKNVIDWHLLLLYSYNGDGIMKNFYLYKLDTHTPFRVAIWDYDHSFGRDGDNEQNMMERPLRMERSILFSRLLSAKDMDYESQLAERYAQLRDQGLFGLDYMEKAMTKIDKQINGAVSTNAKLWPTDSKWYYDANDYEAEKILLLDFIKMRLKSLDGRFGYTIY